MLARTFRAMGTTARVVLTGGSAELLDSAVDTVQSLERRWSRFLPDSELSRLNRLSGVPVMLPRDTFDLVTAAVRAWSLTAGRFDPTVLAALESAGYDRSFEHASLVPLSSRRSPSPGCAGIELDDDLTAVRLPAGVTIDLGGIAKGHTADVVAMAMLDGGADGAIVDLGGDVRVAGLPIDGDAWQVGVADPFDASRDLATLRLADGAVATSSAVRRRWTHAGETLHHIIDPATGRPAARGIAAVTVVAASAAWAEVTAKAALVAGDGAGEVVRAAGVTGLAVHDDGRCEVLDGLEVFS